MRAEAPPCFMKFAEEKLRRQFYYFIIHQRLVPICIPVLSRGGASRVLMDQSG